MPQNEAVVSGEKKTVQAKFESGKSWYPFAVSGFHLLLLLACGVLIAVGYGCFSGSLLSRLGLPVSAIGFQAFCFGVIGGTLCASRWVIMAVGRKIYDRNRILWQLLIPIHGGFLAIFVLIAVKAGLMSMVTDGESDIQSGSDRYQWLILTLAFLSGFASKVLIERIEGMARALFGKEPESKSTIQKPEGEPAPGAEQ